VPIQESWPARLGETSLTWTKVALAAFFAAWIVRLLLGRDRVRLTPLFWAMGAYCIALVASVAHARDIGSWAEETYRWGVATLVYLAAVGTIRTGWERRWLMLALATGIVGSISVGIYQVITSSGPESFAQRGFLRAYGLFGEPNPFAGYLEMATLPLLAVGLSALSGNGRAFRWVGSLSLLAAGAGVLGIALTQSRGGSLGLAAGLALILWFLWPRWGRILVTGGLLAALVLILSPAGVGLRAAFGIDSLFNSGPTQITPANFAAQERLAHWGAALRMWLSEPWLGIGAGNYPVRFREFTPNWRFRISRGHAHSAYLQAAAQAGLVGLVCYLALLIVAWRRCLRAYDRLMARDSRAFCIGAMAVTAAIMVHGVFEYLHVLSLGIVLSAVWALSECDCAPRAGELVNHGDG
jgi:O-antigen ligase